MNGNILQLKITLEESNPKIWRRFLVSDFWTFDKLHRIIQKVMGWENYHLYEFEIGDQIVALDNDEDYNFAEGALDKLTKSSEFKQMLENMDLSKADKGGVSLNVNKVNKILSNIDKGEKKKVFLMKNTRIFELIKDIGTRFYYRYDFGDNWEHEIIIEKITKDNIEKQEEIPICLSGERACPPEDCGGTWGYEELLEIQKNKKHPEYEEKIVEWLGKDFDSEKFDIDEVNKELNKR